MTILNHSFNTPYKTAPFSKIKTEDYLSAFNIAIEKAKAEIDAIASNEEAPNFENTIAALDYSGEELDRISSIFFNLNSAETDDAIQKTAQEVLFLFPLYCFLLASYLVTTLFARFLLTF